MQYKALIVDDSKLARMVMASAFRRLGPEWELIEATNRANLQIRGIGGQSAALIDSLMAAGLGPQTAAGATRLRGARLATVGP